MVPDFYIFRCSYAGKYISSVAVYILQLNQSPGQFQLRGVGIGDGLTDPVTYYSNYVFAAGLMDEGERAVVQKYDRKSIQAIKMEEWKAVYPTIEEAHQHIGLRGGNVSIYDVRSFIRLYLGRTQHH